MKAGKTMTGLALVAGAFLGLGCGEDDGESEAADARAAVADYLSAVVNLDPAAACSLLTSQGQQQIVIAVRRAPKISPAGDCEGSLQNLWEGATPVGDPQLDEFADGVRQGNLRGQPIRVSIKGDSAVVVLSPGKRGLQVPVEKVDDHWLVTNGTGALFSFGVDQIP